MENNIIMNMLHQKEEKAAEEKRLITIKNYNNGELNRFFGTFSLSESGKEELSSIVQTISERIFVMKGALLEELVTKVNDVEEGDKTFENGKTKAFFKKTAFSVLYVASPNLEKQVLAQRAKIAEEAKKAAVAKEAAKAAARKHAANAKREFWLNKRLGTSKVPDRFFRFQERFDIPLSKTYFNGSPAYVARLATLYHGAVLYGNVDDDIFAVASKNNKGEDTVTFYVKEIDFRKEFAERLVKDAGMTKKLATKLSQALPHDQWYNIQEVTKGVEHILDYSGMIVRKLYAKEGEVIHDFFQGDLQVFAYGKVTLKNGKEFSPCYVPIQDEPSAILVRNMLYIYLPD